ncbi:palmitoyltransferase ZDHHC15A-like isoform X3 [Alosa sapidissima]|uniref:palmitoyltransferase ZDHHC15A-like isoform X3 n=1 Tax=Alosa sapidissima TaxID=34773 RepID=UPI001C08A377|nr:palmitoyltransferase ZDHHC15A-like isoform X3 [Alosa sapidissima]
MCFGAVVDPCYNPHNGGRVVILRVCGSALPHHPDRHSKKGDTSLDVPCLFWDVLLGILEFQLSLSDRQRYAEQETPEAQRRVLLEISQKLPVHSRSASGGVYLKWITTVHGRLNNCVGFSNYKFFLLFLAFSLLYCLFIVATVAPYFVKFWLGPFLNHSTVKVHVLFLMVVSLMFAITLSFLLGFHCWLVIKNKTTVEWLSAPFFSYGPDRRAFDVGLKPNVLQVFGSQRRFWLLPVFSSHGDGQVFPLRRKLLLPYTHGVQLNGYWEEAETRIDAAIEGNIHLTIPPSGFGTCISQRSDQISMWKLNCMAVQPQPVQPQPR